MSRVALTALGVAAGLLTSPVADLVGQEPGGSVVGVVVDQDRDVPVPAAVVLVEDTPLSAVADADGRFRILDLRPGTYSLRVVAPGFHTGRRESVRVAPGDTVRLRLEIEPGYVELPGLVVTARRGPERPGESPASVAVMQGGEVAARSAITVDDALPFIPGVILNHGQLDIRGVTGLARGVGSRVLVLLDGHRFLSPAGGSVNFDILPVLDLERVEVVKGPASALYGSNALGGVVNFVREPIGEDPATKLRSYLGVYDVPSRFEFTGEELTAQGLDVLHTRRFGNGVGASLFLGRKTSDGFHQNGDFSRWLVEGRVVAPRDADRPWDLYALWAREDREEFFTWRSEDRPLEVDPEARGDWLRSDKIRAGATVTPLANNSIVLQARPFLNHNSVQNHFHDNEDFHRSSQIGVDLQVALQKLRDHQLMLGGELANTSVESNILGEPSLLDAALFLEDEVDLTPALTATAGLRVDLHDTDVSETELRPNPRIGVVFEPADQAAGRVSLARGYRAPSAAEQFVSTAVFGFQVIPNLDLSGESAWTGEVGVSLRLGRAWVDAALFQTEFDDLIEPAAVPGRLFTFQFRNVTEARVRGLDLGARVSLLPGWLDMQLSYTWLDTEDRARDRPLPYRSEHNVALTLEGAGGLVAVDYRHRSRVERVLVFPLDPRDPINLVDVRLRHRILGTGIQLKVDNLLQHDYVDVQERNLGSPRRFLLSLRRSF